MEKDDLVRDSIREGLKSKGRLRREAAANEALVIRTESTFAPATGGNEGGNARYTRFRKTFSLTGDFPAIQRFVTSVEALPDLLAIPGFAATRPAGGGPLTVEVGIDVVKLAGR